MKEQELVQLANDSNITLKKVIKDSETSLLLSPAEQEEIASSLHCREASFISYATGFALSSNLHAISFMVEMRSIFLAPKVFQFAAFSLMAKGVKLHFILKPSNLSQEEMQENISVIKNLYAIGVRLSVNMEEQTPIPNSVTKFMTDSYVFLGEREVYDFPHNARCSLTKLPLSTFFIKREHPEVLKSKVFSYIEMEDRV